MPSVPPPIVPKVADDWLLAMTDGTFPLSQPAIAVVVSKYDPENETTPFTILTNVVCMTISERLGSSPPTARFKYVFGTADLESPQTFEEALNDAFNLERVVEVDDRIVVHAQRPNDLRWVPIFDGYALGFHLALSGQQEIVHFDAIGHVRQAFNIPTSGVLWRDSNALTDPTGDNIAVDVPGHFNPGGKPNCIPATGWSKDDYNAYPVFCDVANGFAEDWDLTRACRYLIFGETEKNPIDDLDLPEGAYLDKLLVAKEPIAGKTFNPDDSTTYTTTEIEVADKPFDAKPWPAVVEHLIGDKGFAFAWELNPDPNSEFTLPPPRHFLSLFRPQSSRDGHDQPTVPKQAWLQPRGQTLDLAYTNANSYAISRDVTEVVNEWDVEGELEEWEASLVLVPAFSNAINTVSAYANYRKTVIKTADASLYNAFRLFIADEAGDGHYLNGSSTLATTPLNLDDILGVPVDPVTGDPLTPDPTTGLFDPSGIRQYAHRRRPTLGQLLTQPINGSQSYRASLSYSYDYGGNGMQTLTPTGTLTSGSFTLGVGSATTSSLAYNVTASAIQAALAGLSTVGSGNVYCSGGPINVAPVCAFFVGAKAGKTMPGMVLTSSVGGGTLTASSQSTGGAKYPAVWDGTGTWYGIAGGYTVLKDRIGIYVDCDDPNSWIVDSESRKELKLVECLSNPSNVNRPVYLRLTCTFRGDKRMRGSAKMSTTTVGGFELVNGVLTERVKRKVEARDRYKRQLVHSSSEFFGTPDYDEQPYKVKRDDTASAQAEAVAMQQATMGGILGGPITVPRFTTYYKLGDRIDKINGRALTFRTDSGNDNEPIYPVLVGRTWNLDGGQSTTLQLSDANTARRSYASKFRMPHHGGGRTYG